MAGLGVIGVGVGVAFGLKVLSQKDEIGDICPLNVNCTPDDKARSEKLEDEARPNATAFNIAVALGGAATLGGIALVLTAPSSPSPGATGVKVVPWGGPNAAGASIAGRW